MVKKLNFTLAVLLIIALTSCKGAGDTPTASTDSSSNSLTDYHPNGIEVESQKRSVEERLGWDKVPEGAQSTTLPDDLGNTIFIGDDDTEVKCLPGGKATIQTPQDPAPVDATYEKKPAPDAIVFKYENKNGKQCQAVFAATCSGRKARLNITTATEPKLPSYMRGTLP